MHSSFSTLDWLIFGGYLCVLALSSYLLSRLHVKSTREFFTSKNTISMFAAAISLLATSQSAATFLGVPEFSYRFDFTLLGFYFSSLLGAVFIIRYLIPRFYSQGAITVYELLQKRYGEHAKKQAGITFLIGRVMASGARLYIAALAVSMILFFDISFTHMLLSITLLLAGALGYSYFGGIKSVIYSDILQALFYISAGVLVFYYLYATLQNPAPLATLSELGKLRVLDFSLDGKFNVFALLGGWLLLNIAAFGLDQDMTQRLLTCKNQKEASYSLVLALLLSIPVVALFLGIGALLFLHYNTQEITQSFAGEKITVFMHYILTEMPSGLKGFVTVGAVAAALSSTNSVLAAMASVAIEDIYKPYKLHKNPSLDEAYFLQKSRQAVLFFGAVLFVMAVVSYVWQRHFEIPLINFALGVLSFAYTGLLGVFFAAIFTQRGSQKSVPYALVGGFVTVLLLQPYIFGIHIGFAWQMLVGTAVSFGIMMLSKGDDK